MLPSGADVTKDPIRFRLSVLITAIGVVLAAGHVILPFVAIDGITVALLIAAVAPWLGHVFKAFEIAGTRFEYRDLLRAEDEIARAGLVATATPKQTESLPPSANDDPLITLAALRIELEKRLRQIAKAEGIDLKKRPGSIAMVTRELSSTGALTPQESAALIDMAGTLNRAVHAESVDPISAQWALRVGPTILASLDEKISTVASSNSVNK
jgi:hypothetical protein